MNGGDADRNPSRIRASLPAELEHRELVLRTSSADGRLTELLRFGSAELKMVPKCLARRHGRRLTWLNQANLKWKDTLGYDNLNDV
jgi:hypothetical protein